MLRAVLACASGVAAALVVRRFVDRRSPEERVEAARAWIRSHLKEDDPIPDWMLASPGQRASLVDGEDLVARMEARGATGALQISGWDQRNTEPPRTEFDRNRVVGRTREMIRRLEDDEVLTGVTANTLANYRIVREKVAVAFFSRVAGGVLRRRREIAQRDVVERWRVERGNSFSGNAQYVKSQFVWFPYLARCVDEVRLSEMEDQLLQFAMSVGEDDDVNVPVVAVTTLKKCLWQKIALWCPDNNRLWRKREFSRLMAVIPAAKRVLNYISLKYGPLRPRDDVERRSAYIACGDAIAALSRTGDIPEPRCMHASIARCAVALAVRGYHIREPAARSVPLAY